MVSLCGAASLLRGTRPDSNPRVNRLSISIVPRVESIVRSSGRMRTIRFDRCMRSPRWLAFSSPSRSCDSIRLDTPSRYLAQYKYFCIVRCTAAVSLWYRVTPTRYETPGSIDLAVYSIYYMHAEALTRWLAFSSPSRSSIRCRIR